MSSIKQEVGSGIRLIRKAKGISQEKLADAAGVSPPYMGEVERGLRNISIETLEKVSEALGVLPVDILRASGFQNSGGQNGKSAALEKHLAFMSILTKRDIELIHKIAKDIFTHIEQD